jgi:hypothetical protein
LQFRDQQLGQVPRPPDYAEQQARPKGVHPFLQQGEGESSPAQIQQIGYRCLRLPWARYFIVQAGTNSDPRSGNLVEIASHLSQRSPPAGWTGQA